MKYTNNCFHDFEGKYLNTKLLEARLRIAEATKVIGTDESRYTVYSNKWNQACGRASTNIGDLPARQEERKRLLSQIRSGILGISTQKKKLRSKGNYK